MLKNETKEKKEKKNKIKKTKKITTIKKKKTKNIIKKIQQKRERPKKEWVEGEEEPTEKYLSRVLPESFSFLFMKLYRNVYQIKSMCRIQL